MKLFGIQFGETDKNIKFGNTRVYRNTVAQLAKNNPFSLSEPNQRRIINSISALAKIPGERNIKFLLNTAANSTYSTNITSVQKPKNNWKELLLAAIASAISITPFINQTAFAKKIDRINTHKSLTDDEKAILELKDALLNKVDLEQIQRETAGTIKDFEKNLDYFIISSETTVQHKKYVLERLNYLMSDDYEINEQLKDKKSIVAAEMVNDMAIAVPGNKIPNIKAVNQRNHGICAEISIVRKKLAYEDKPNYVDSILSELDNSNMMQVYDRSKLGSGEKIYVPKSPVDYDAALNKGYRIIDASSMVWMQTSNYSGYTNVPYTAYTSFDRENFDVKNDSFFNTEFEEADLAKMQGFYQALLKLKSAIEYYKTSKIKKEVKRTDIYSNLRKYHKEMASLTHNIKRVLTQSIPDMSSDDINKLAMGILQLRHKYSKNLSKDNKYEYIPNEEDSVKKVKVKEFIENFSSVSINDKALNKIFDNAEAYKDIQESLASSNYKMSLVAKAQALYEIAAAFRSAFLQGIENGQYREMLATNEGLPNKEQILLDAIDTLIEKCKTDDYINKYLSNIICAPTNTKDVVSALNVMRLTSKYYINNLQDDIYKNLLLKDKRHALISNIENMIVQISDNKDSALKNSIASQLNISNYEKVVIGTLNSYKIKLLNCSDKEYSYIFDKLYGNSQYTVLFQYLDEMEERLNSDEKDHILELYRESVENPDDINEEVIKNMLQNNRQEILKAQALLDEYIGYLRIVDANGHVLYSADKRDILLKKYENLNEIISSKDLSMLQDHIDKIMRDRAHDEFNYGKQKTKDKSLNKFSAREMQILSIIDKNVNSMYSYVQKYLSDLRLAMKYPLEELNRISGENLGRWWMMEGNSGLFTSEEVRLLEFITGRPHYATKELKTAIDKIKSSPYSGVSTSSVYDDKIGMHAQYIADIAPVKLKQGNAEVEKDILFQDNTWGPREHENTWVDSAGLLRTDYSDRRGGKLGYVTNEMYRNGNIVERILNDMTLEEKSSQVDSKIYKKIKKDRSSDYKSSQYSEIILDGKSPKLKEYADDIRQNIFQSTVHMVNVLKKLVSDRNTSEINEKIKTASFDGGNWKLQYDIVLNRIYDIFKGNPDIEGTYNSLSETDDIKLLVEKVALKSNYNSTLMINDIAKVTKVSDLSKFEKRQRLNAIKNFKYSFNKDENFINYYLNNFDEKNVGAIDKILDRYDIKLEDDVYDDIFVTYNIENADWNGSLKDTIDLILRNMSVKMDKYIPNKSAKTDLLNYMRTSMRETLYFNKSDLNNPKLNVIINFIDRVFNPVDDEEFVSIYRSIQDMTNSEFKKQILSKATNFDLGIKRNRGIDVIKKLLNYDEGIEQSIMNEVYYDNISKIIEENTYKPLYSYNKLTRDISYSYRENFDSAYRKVRQDLSLLELPRLFNKYKNNNLVKYGAYPAYPRIDYIDKSMFQGAFESVIGKIPEIVESSNFAKNTERYYELIEELKKYIKTKSNDDVLNDEEYENFNTLLGEIATSIYGNELQQDALNEVLNAMELEQGVKFIEYKKYINKVIKSANNYKKSFGINDINNLIKANNNRLQSGSEIFVNTFIQKQHRARMFNLINQYIQSLSKKKPKKDLQPEDYLQQIAEKYDKWHILHNTKELLDTYIESLASDSSLNADRKNNIETMLINAICYARLADMETIIMDAIDSGNETMIKDAFKEIYLETVDGSIVPMSSDSIISQMVDSLILTDNKDTAFIFLEKLGLNEQYAKFFAKYYNIDELKEQIEVSEKEDKNFRAFVDVFNKLTEDAYNNPLIEVKPNRVINKLKRDVMAALKENSISLKIARPLIKSFDDAKKTIELKPTLKKADVLQSMLNDGMYSTIILSDRNNDDLNHLLSRTQLYIELLNGLALNKDSEANKLREETINKWQDFLAYCGTKENLHVG